MIKEFTVSLLEWRVQVEVKVTGVEEAVKEPRSQEVRRNINMDGGQR